MVNTLCVGTLNVRGISSKQKIRLVFNYLQKHKIDVACLQETCINNNTVHDMKREWRGNLFHIQGTNRPNDLAILTGSKIIHAEMGVSEKKQTRKGKKKRFFFYNQTKDQQCSPHIC